MRMIALFVLCLTITASGDVAAQNAVPTQVMIRAVSNDAKIIGDAAGGVRIVVTDVESGAVLTEGVQRGGTGSTDLIINQPYARGTTRFDTEGAAGFMATLDLTEPTFVEITAHGPLQPAHAETMTSLRTWLVPGKDVLGEGIVLTLYGFAVEIDPAFDPATGHVRAKVTMLCTCPTSPGGLWDADRIDVTATLLRSDTPVQTIDLTYAGEQSTFSGTIPVPTDPGEYILEVTASDTARANFGVASVSFRR